MQLRRHGDRLHRRRRSNGAMLLARREKPQTVYMHKRALGWSRKHASLFEPKRYQLVHFAGRVAFGGNGANLSLPARTIKATDSCKYLGVHIDNRLKFHVHLKHT